jgi:hypothetical protein
LIAGAITTTDLAIYLSIYASVVSTAAALWALFSGVVRDRARIDVEATEAFFLVTNKGQQVIKAEDTLDNMGVPPELRREVLRVVVRNRGRRDARIEKIGQLTLTGARMFGDISDQVPFDLKAETSKVLLLGVDGGYQHGDISPRRFYAEDGAGRRHPLWMRWRIRLEMIAYRWALNVYWRRKRRQRRNERLAARREID